MAEHDIIRALLGEEVIQMDDTIEARSRFPGAQWGSWHDVSTREKWAEHGAEVIRLLDAAPGSTLRRTHASGEMIEWRFKRK